MSVNQMCNAEIRVGCAHQRLWIGVGEAVHLPNGSTLGVERATIAGLPRLVYVLTMQNGARFEVCGPEELRAYTADALVRFVEYRGGEPARALVDIGELVAFPVLHERVQ